MNIFTIDEDNNITAYAGAREAAQAGDATTTTFDSPAALAKISAGWPLSRFVEIWNAIQPLAVDGPPSEALAKSEKPTESAKATKKAKAAKKAKVTTRTSAA